MRRLLSTQPVAVWAVAFAAVVSFMGLGLVDPILPAIAHDLRASPSDVELLFTSYFAFTGISMLFSSVVASRIGTKKTLMCGLVLIIIFSAAAGSSNTVGEIVGLRAGWGFGNALFIATALAVIVGAASGGVAGAVMIYEAALGLGISLGPLVGGELGGISWRGPFYGVACLMAVGFVAIARFLPKTPVPAQRISVLEPLRALRHRATRGSGLTAIFYNFGFFTLLGYAPFPLHLGVHDLGYTFTAWGLLLAIFAVFVAPRLSRRFSDVTGLGGALVGIVVVLLVMGIAHASQTALIVCVICSGMFFGITNTLMTQVVMESAPVSRPIASSAYSFVRFCGGAVAPFIAGKLGEHVSMQAPFYLGAGMTAIAVGMLLFYRKSLVPIEEAAGDDNAPAPEAHAVPASLRQSRRLVIAVGGGNGPAIATLAAPLARAQGAEVHVLHVIERDIVAGEDAIELESDGAARDQLDDAVTELQAAGVSATGELLHATGTHADIATRILARTGELEANTIVVGPQRNHRRANQVVGEIAARASAHVIVLHPEAGPLGRSQDTHELNGSRTV
ncbi:MAG TPA: MFS transporter [Solirubrobacteraceae bacterium]|nr:MFS transporter [Solirubrobacteraceae bacterium]